MTSTRPPALTPLALALALGPLLTPPAQAQSAPPPATAASAPEGARRGPPPGADGPPANRPQGRPEAKSEAKADAKPQAKEAAKPAEADQAQKLNLVEVQGTASDESKRRASTAAKIVIGREEIERYGDSSIGEVLKRLPGVTTGGRPGRGGEVRMRGMGGGYTQILVNGERMPPGFSLDELPPEQIERIEVMRAPTAEFGARAVAGTINVVLREALQRKLNEVRMAVSSERGQLRPNLSWTRNDKLDDQGGAYNLTVNAMQNKRIDDVNTSSLTRVLATGEENLLRTLGQNSEERKSLNMTGRLQWRLGEGSQFALQPFIAVNKGDGRNHFVQIQEPEVSDTRSPFYYRYDEAQTQSDNRFTMMRLNSQWTQRLSEASRFELRASLGKADGKGHTVREEFKDGASVRTQDDRTDNNSRSWNLTGKYSQQLENEHSLVAGLEAEGNRNDQTRVCLQNGASCSYLLDFGDDLSASTQRLAAYAQDEWNVGKQWSFYAGLRWEGIKTESSAKNYAVSNSSGVWTPLLHALYKLDEKNREQIRASLTRSYRSPNVQDLIAKPSINSQYPCLSNQACGANEVNYPDRMGNPDLRPELATGLEIGYEKYLTKGGVLSANLFYRRITDLIRNVAELETVSWAPVQRWVSKPRNIGNARTVGLELEAKFRLDEYLEEALPINIRSNLSLFKSKVDGIQGPNNRLDQQPRYTANLGADYKLRSLPLTLGAGLNYTPSSVIQQTTLTQISASHKRVVDAFASWALNRDTQLRLSASNLAPLDYGTGSVTLTPTKEITSTSTGRSFTVWQLRLEIKV